MNTICILDDVSGQTEVCAGILADMLRRNGLAFQPVPSDHVYKVTPRAVGSRTFSDPAHDMPRCSASPYDIVLDLSKKGQQAKVAAATKQTNTLNVPQQAKVAEDVATTSNAAAKKQTNTLNVPQQAKAAEDVATTSKAMAKKQTKKRNVPQQAKAAADVATTSKAAAKKQTNEQPTGSNSLRPAQLVVPASAAPAPPRLTTQGEVVPRGATSVRPKRAYTRRVERVKVSPVEASPAPKRVRTVIKYKRNP